MPREILRLRGRRLQERNGLFLAENPLCRHCLDKGRVSPAVEVDHIIPLFKGGLDVHENWQGLCIPCHKTKTALDMNYKQTGCDASGQPTSSSHHWNAVGGGSKAGG
jgi:5-methylcytosine-specific restriction endonuclease McrA